MRVLGISGSLRRDSHNTKLLRAAGELAEAEGAEFEVFDGLKAIPPYDRSEEHTSELQSQSKHVCRLLLEKKHGEDGQDRVVHQTPEDDGLHHYGSTGVGLHPVGQRPIDDNNLAPAHGVIRY